MSHCLICNKELEHGNTYTCDWCTADTCYKCRADDITRDGRKITCTHGCEYSIHEHITHTYYTILLNGTPAEKLAATGPEIEVIIPNGTPITVRETRPDPETLTDGHITLLHYTHDKQAVLNDGIEYPPNENSRDSEEPAWAHETIRHNAVYGWPFTAGFATTFGAFSNSKYTDAVYLTVDESRVRVSAYDFLTCMSDSGSISFSRTDTDETTIQIPVDKYEAEFTFEIDALRRAVTQYNRPFTREHLLV